MADFVVNVKRILAEPTDHPNADRLSLVMIDDITVVSAKTSEWKHRVSVNDYVVYIPEHAILPEFILKYIGLWDSKKEKGAIGGPNGNLVSPVKLRGIISDGIILPLSKNDDGMPVLPKIGPIDCEIVVSENQDVSEILGITKWEPDLPVELTGKVINILGSTIPFDVNSINKHPATFVDGEMVLVTEKLHGTNMQIGYVPGLNNNQLFHDGNLYVTSKMLAKKGFVFCVDETTNLYVRMLNRLIDHGIGDAMNKLSETNDNKPITIIGELIGSSMADLKYGLTDIDYRVFEMRVGTDIANYKFMQTLESKLNVPMVPVLYYGPFDKNKIMQHRDGKSTLTEKHIREGITIRSDENPKHLLKWVSPQFQSRKGNRNEIK